MECIRQATLEDVAQLVPLVESAYRGDSSRRGWTTEADYLDGQRTDADDVSAAISATGQLILVNEVDGRLLASVHVKHSAGEGACYLGMFAVSPLSQGNGLGRRMVQAAERAAVEVFGASRMRMYVISVRDSLIAWYQRLGYAATGETAPFPYGNPRFGLPKRDDLQFIILERNLS